MTAVAFQLLLYQLWDFDDPAGKRRLPRRWTAIAGIYFGDGRSHSRGNLSTPAQSLRFEKGSVFAISVETQSGGDWLTVVRDEGARQSDEFLVRVAAMDLAPGVYHATITFTGDLTNGSSQFPVTLTLLRRPPAGLTVAPATLRLTARAG